MLSRPKAVEVCQNPLFSDSKKLITYSWGYSNRVLSKDGETGYNLRDDSLPTFLKKGKGLMTLSGVEPLYDANVQHNKVERSKTSSSYRQEIHEVFNNINLLKESRDDHPDLKESGREHSTLNEMVNDTKEQNVISNTDKIMNGLQYAKTNERRIGKILFYSNKEIGRGCNGTVVWEGLHHDRPVAVKRILKSHYGVTEWKEIKTHVASDNHPNIVTMYDFEVTQDIVYIALELCTCSLHELILSRTNLTPELQRKTKVLKDLKLWEPNGYPSGQLLQLMRGVVSGLAHLHYHRIIHQDLKPQNVLIRKDSSIYAKVSDMGISKLVPADKSSLTNSSEGKGLYRL